MANDPLLYLVEDDAAFARTLQRSFERRGYTVALAADPAELEALLADRTPDYAVVDLKLGQASGLSCVQLLNEHDPDIVIVVLTGYASIATAVQAIKLGATSYLAKPADTDDIEAAFGMIAGDVATPIGERQTSLKTLEWERIHKTLAETDFNVSETARRLGMHRRTLARKLEKEAAALMPDTADIAIRLRRAAFNRALAARDVDAIGPLLARDAVLVTGTDSAVLSGRKAQLIAWKREFAAPSPTIYTRTPEMIAASPVAPVAMEYGRWQGVAGGETMAAGTYAAKWRLAGAEWVIEAEIFVTLA